MDGGRREQGKGWCGPEGLGVGALEVLVATHPDADHYGGLLQVVEEVPIGLALLSPAFPQDHPLVQALEERGVPLLFPHQGKPLPGGEGKPGGPLAPSPAGHP